MHARTRYLLTLSGLLVLLACLQQTIGQQQEPHARSAEKIRRLIREIREAKTEDERWCLAIRGVRSFFEDAIDTPAAVTLLEELDDALEKSSDDEPSPLLIGPLHLDRALNSGLFPHAQSNFMVSLLPLLEEPRKDAVATSALYRVVHYYLSSDDLRIDDWIAKYLRKGQVPPRGFIDKIFEADRTKAAEEILWRMMRLDERERQVVQVLSKEALAYLYLCQHSIRLTYNLDFILQNEDWPEEVRREFEKSFQTEKERSRRIIVQTWQLCSQWYVRRYITHWVRLCPHLFLTPEIMKLMRQENHPTIRPLVKELEEVDQRFFPNNP